MAVLKQTSPTAWPSAPRPKPSSTVPSASTRSAVGLWSGQAELFSGDVMSALHSRHILMRQSRKTRIHMRFGAYLTARAGLLICDSPLKADLPPKTAQSGVMHGQYDADPARSRPGVVAPDIRARAFSAVAIRPGDGGQPYPRRQHGRNRAPDSGRGAAALRAGRAFDGRLHRLRDHAAGAGPRRKTGADQHPGAAGYAGSYRPPPRPDGAGAGGRIPRHPR